MRYVEKEGPVKGTTIESLENSSAGDALKRACDKIANAHKEVQGWGAIAITFLPGELRAFHDFLRRHKDHE